MSSRIDVIGQNGGDGEHYTNILYLEKTYSPLMGGVFTQEGSNYFFVGIVITEEGYYYIMRSLDGEVEYNLSCLRDLAYYGFVEEKQDVE